MAALALRFSHRHGVVHRDVKPESIFLDAATDRVLLSDFGMARVEEAMGMLKLMPKAGAVVIVNQAFAKKFNKNIVLDSVIDKEILGGLVVQIQGLTFDGSLKNAIRRLKETLERQSV